MKTLIFVLLASLAVQAEEFNFKFNIKNDKFSVNVKASSWDDAFHDASKKCIRYYAPKQPLLSESVKEMLIDQCNNPNSRMLGQDK